MVARSVSRDVALPTGGATDTVDLRVDHARPVVDDAIQPCTRSRPMWCAVAPRWITPARRSVSAGWCSIPNKGVFVNGRPLKLHGVDLHNDEGALGSVDNYDALWRQMSNLKAMGVNAFRTSHNPPSPELIDVCQRLGIVMMVEAFDAWDVGKVSQDFHLYFNQWSDYDIKEMETSTRGYYQDPTLLTPGRTSLRAGWSCPRMTTTSTPGRSAASTASRPTATGSSSRGNSCGRGGTT